MQQNDQVDHVHTDFDNALSTCDKRYRSRKKPKAHGFDSITFALHQSRRVICYFYLRQAILLFSAKFQSLLDEEA